MEYKVAIIGCGRIGSLLEEDPLRWHPCTHAGAFYNHPATRIVAACDINPDRLKVFGEKWGVLNLFQDYREMFKKVGGIDILSVASWTSTHREIVTFAAKEKGLKAIFCEKPIAANFADAKYMVSVCEEENVLLFINHERRWELDYERVRDLLGGGTLGEVRSVVGNIFTQSRLEANGGDGLEGMDEPLLHDGTHLIDIIHYLFGDIFAVHAMRGGVSSNISSCTVCAVLYAKLGVPIYIIVTEGCEFFNFELDIMCTNGRINVGNGFFKCWRPVGSLRYQGFRDLAPFDVDSRNDSRNPLLYAVQHIIDCIEGRAKNISSGEDGKKAVEVIEKIFISASQRGKLVEI